VGVGRFNYISNILNFIALIRIIVKCQGYLKHKLNREKHKQVSEEALLPVLVEVPPLEDQVLVPEVSNFD
jgi:hypothetical protein